MKTLCKIIFALNLLVMPVLSGTTTIFIGWDGVSYHAPDNAYSVGLALSGGGARGLSQAGILRAFEESGIHVQAIAGTSIGGVIGGLYAAGYTAAELDSIISTIDFSGLFSNRPARKSMFLTQRPEKERYLLSVRFDGARPYIPQALTTGQKLSDLLLNLTLKPNYISGGDFSRLDIPFRAVTTDIVSGEEVILSKGNLADAMRSTMAFPLAFTGIESSDRILMDGGMLNPVPVDVVDGIGCNIDLIVAVNTTSDLLPKEEIKDPIAIANQVTSIMTMNKREAALARADVVITPDIKDYLSTDFDKCRALIDSGYQAGLRAVPEIKAKLDHLNAGDSLKLVEIRFQRPLAPIDSARFPLRPGQLVQKKTLHDIISNIYHDLKLFSLDVRMETVNNEKNGFPAVALEFTPVRRPELSHLTFAISGNTVVLDSTIIAIMKSGGSRLTSEAMAEFSDSLRTLYSSLGFDLARIERMVYHADRSLLEIDIDEAVIHRLEIAGNRRAKNWLIRSNFTLHEGEPLNLNNAQQGIANIYSTDLFDRVTMNILPGKTGATIRLNVEEKKYTQVRLGWHWDDEYHSEEFAEILDDNLFGAGQECLLHVQYAPRRQKYELSLKADRFLSTYLTYRLRTYYNILDRKFYNDEGDYTHSIREDRLGLDFILGQQISRFGTVTGEIRWEDIDARESTTGSTETMRLRTITLRSLVETINRYPFPTDGKKHLFYVEFAADILGGETRYTKFFSSVESYFPLTDWFNFHPGLALGWVDTHHDIPVSERFYIGGQYSFAGYRTDELMGDKMLLGNLGFRFRLPYRFYLTVQYDMGDVYTTADRIKLRNLRHGAGISLAYDSPLGPFDFGYGFTNTDTDRFYFSIGLRF
ncbi:MAG: BamA/TamA family outer membrane protein [Candidatus Zixiibacteriota bacterium]|nr:MAG: BamA/TamA family outer membrane protein [candidate division Zixibacteria bacterium]